MELEESTCLTSDYSLNLQSSRQYGTGTKKYRSMEQNRKPRDKSMHLWTLYLRHICTMEYYSVLKRNTFELLLMRWMSLEPIIQNEVSQKEKDKYCILMDMYRESKKWY